MLQAVIVVGLGLGLFGAIGTVKWFNNLKGHGFIKPNDGGQDVFVHYSDIKGDGYKQLQPDQEVSYDEVDDGRGPKAKNVRKR